MKTKIVSVGSDGRKVELVKTVNLGLVSHEIGEGCFGLHQRMYGIDADGNGYGISARSRWQPRPVSGWPERARRALGLA